MKESNGVGGRAVSLPLAAATIVAVLACAVVAGGADRSRRGFVDRLKWGPGVRNHPVHIRPGASVRIPEGWPLDPDGTITCVTCHEALPSVEGAADPLLRDFDPTFDDPRSFCAKCHGTDHQSSPEGMHWMAVERAHLLDREGGRGGGGGARHAGLDAESNRCLNCHDGVTAGNAVNPITSGRKGASIRGRFRDHPVGFPYPEGDLARGDTRIRPRFLLPAQIRLPEGKVSCVSCHDLYRRDTPARLTVPVAESALCLTCHDMD